METTPSFAVVIRPPLVSSFATTWCSSLLVPSCCKQAFGYVVEPPHLRPVRNKARESRRGLGLTSSFTRGAVIPTVVSILFGCHLLGLVRGTLTLSPISLAICRPNGFDFIPLGFSTLGPNGPATEELLSCICQWYNSHAWIQEWVAHVWVFCRLSFVGRQGVAE